MNLPNKLTMLRILLIPFFVVFMLISPGEAAYRWIALGIFITASLTDLLDGKIARKYGLVTNFGKLMDPLADKMLVSAALICLTALGQLAAWIVIVIISRECIISGLRQIAADNGVVIAASYWGKYKTTFQMIMICLLIAGLDSLRLLTEIVTWAAVILTIVSLIDYMIKNRQVFMEDK